MLAAVKLPDPQRIMNAYPHQISGGQQQRVVIAMALLNPALLILDEPTTALDVTVEAGIVALIKEIAGRFGTSMVYISHNLGLILETCDRITVMYSGEAVESGTVAEVFDQCATPTRAACSTRSRCRVPTRTRGRWSRSRPAAAAAPAAPGLLVRPRCGYFDGDLRPWPRGHGDGRRRRRPWRALPALPRDRLGGRSRTAAGRAAAAGPGRPRGRPAEEVLRARRRLADGDDQGTPAARSRPTSSSTSTPARPRRWRSSANPAAASRPSPR